LERYSIDIFTQLLFAGIALVSVYLLFKLTSLYIFLDCWALKFLSLAPVEHSTQKGKKNFSKSKETSDTIQIRGPVIKASA